MSVILRPDKGNAGGRVLASCCICHMAFSVNERDLFMLIASRGQVRCYCDACQPSSDLKVPAIEAAQVRPVEEHAGTIAMDVNPEHVSLLFKKKPQEGEGA